MTYTYKPQSLAGKAIIITGGTTGIGRATAQRLVSEGAHVLIYGRHDQELQDALQDILGNGAGKVYGLTADSAHLEDIQRVFTEADEKLGGVDILINNAAEAAQSILDSDYPEWQYVVQTNLLGYMACCREAIDRMKKKGQGHILNIGSMSAKARNAGSDVYVATKSGIEGFSDALSKQVNEQGIKVTMIEPGLVGTDMTLSKVPQEQQPQKQAEGAILTSEDIAECVYYTLIQPARCAVDLVQIRPLKEAI